MHIIILCKNSRAALSKFSELLYFIIYLRMYVCMFVFIYLCIIYTAGILTCTFNISQLFGLLNLKSILVSCTQYNCCALLGIIILSQNPLMCPQVEGSEYHKDYLIYFPLLWVIVLQCLLYNDTIVPYSLCSFLTVLKREYNFVITKAS